MPRFLLFALALLSGTSSAIAEEGTTSGATDGAQRLFDRAIELRKVGKQSQACPLFEESYALDPARGTLLNIARCRVAAGALLAARTAYQELLSSSISHGDDARAAAARAELEELHSRMPLLILTARVKPPAGTIRVDGKVVSVDDSIEISLDPGRHEVVRSEEGRQTWRQSFVLSDGQRLKILIPGLTLIAQPEPVILDSASIWTRRRTWIVVGAGAAATAAGAGTYWGLDARTKWRESSQSCNSDRSLCDIEGRNKIRASRVAAKRSTWSLAIAGGFTLASLAIWLWPQSSNTSDEVREPTVQWKLSPGYAEARLRW